MSNLSEARFLMDRIAARFFAIRVINYDPIYCDQVVAIGREIHAESVYSDMPFDENKLIRQLSGCGSIVPSRYFQIAVRGDTVLGGFFGCVSPAFFSDAIIAKDMGWWVMGSMRGSAAAILLLADFEIWAISRGAKKIIVGQTGVKNIERTTKLFKNCGFSVIGFNAGKDL